VTGKKLDVLYPLDEKQPEKLLSRSGRPFASLSFEAVADGTLDQGEFAITAKALHLQAEVARAAGRESVARNFERAAELVDIPQETVMEIYEWLRPGRLASEAALREKADFLRREYGAERIATMLEEAATIYERRGLFRPRY
jgi:propanediol dehydratase small subunit